LDTGADDPQAMSAKAAPQRESAPPAAPVSRGSSGRSAVLTPLEREYAEISGMSEQEYAKAKEEMRKAGRMH
jgi:phage I-like protein